MNESINEVYVLQPDGKHTGPITTETLARGILAGRFASDVLVAPPGAPRWLHASQVPAVLALVESLRRASSVPPPGTAPRVATAVSPVFAPPVAPSPARISQLTTQLSREVAPPAPDTTPNLSGAAAPTTASRTTDLGATVAPSSVSALAAPTLSSPSAAVFSPLAVSTPAPHVEVKVDAPKPVAAAQRPWPRWLPLAFFGAFAIVALLECVVAAVVASRAESADVAAAKQTPDKP
jgi:hypothetical protein